MLFSMLNDPALSRGRISVLEPTHKRPATILSVEMPNVPYDL